MKRLAMTCTALACALAPGVAHAQDSPSGGGQGMQAGGLAPPADENEEDQDSAKTEQKLEDADKKDTGRGLEWVYLNGEIGLESLGLQTFQASHNIVDSKVVPTTETGLLYGGGLGVRIVFITLGARFRLGSFSHYDVWTLDGELGLRIPLGSVEPYFVLGGGYATLGSFSTSDLGGVSAKDVSVKGYDIRGGGGIDFYVTPVFSIGANVTGEVLGLTRPGVSLSKLQSVTSGGTPAPTNPQQAQAAANQVYQASGSSVGGGLSATAVLGLHF